MSIGSPSSEDLKSVSRQELFSADVIGTSQMSLIGLLTEDPRTYFETLEVLRSEGLKFVSLDFYDPIPANVAVIITTKREQSKISFDRLVTEDDPEAAVSEARVLLLGDRAVRELTIGIDPGKRPGFAVIGDGAVILRSIAASPEAVGSLVDEIVKEYPGSNVVVRIGHGDRTNRNRIFNVIWDAGLRVEIVDERNTTRRSQTPDEDAAVEIAMTPGYRPRKKQDVEPGPGEIKNVQRISRLESSGLMTLSKELARKVAKGEISMEEAIELQMNSSSNKD